ncbi:hypothetical protein ACJMK2_008011 [Sinanodonta woodiana]|uniref:C2H2-type domain-containing protein n=1 Tax=Sinanodonta woodiana TaxID=1069815 RepID=A0ABD3VL61_SINWO
MQGDRTGIKCNRCAAILPNAQTFENHKNTFHTTLYTCRHCPKRFMQSQSLASHCRVAHKDVIKKRQLLKKGGSLNLEQCNCCGKPFTSLTKLKVHMKKFHTEENQNEAKKTKANLKNHGALSKQDPSFEVYIDTCGTDDPEHHQASTSTFQLNYDDGVGAGSNMLVKEESQLIMNQADENDENFSSGSDDGEITKVRKDTASKRKKSRSNSGLYRCKYCPKTFALSTLLASHVRCHYIKLQEGSIKCGTCSANASSMTELRAHVNKLHVNCRSYCCGLCGYLTNQIGKFRLHLQYTHMQIQYKCTICRRPFHSNILLKKHYLKEHAVKKQGKPKELLRCDQCRFKCYTDEDMEVHQKVHIQKLINCNLCTYACYSEDLLAKHKQQAHTRSKPALRTIVKNEVEVVNEDVTMPTVELLPFSCGMCGSKFPKTEYLLHHITVHIEGKYIFKRNNDASDLSTVSDTPNKSLDGQEKCGSQEKMSGLKHEATASRANVSNGRNYPNHNRINSHSSCSDNLEGDTAKVTFIQNEYVHSRAQKRNSLNSDQRKYIFSPKSLKVPSTEDIKSTKLISDSSDNDICPSTGWLTDQYTSKPWFECPHCFKFLNNIQEFQKHIATHGSKSVIRSLICSICKRQFAGKMSLQRHETTHRNNEYQCKCGKGFVSSALVMTHMKHCEEAGLLGVKK